MPAAKPPEFRRRAAVPPPEVLGELLGQPCRCLGPLPSAAAAARAFLVGLADGQVVVAKVYDGSSALLRAVGNMTSLAGIGVPVPEVLAWSDSLGAEPSALLVMTHVVGHELGRELPAMNRRQLSNLAARVVDIQATVAAAYPVLAGCGYAGVGEPATRTWSDVVRRPNGFRYADPLPGDTAELYEMLGAALDEAESSFRTIRPVCFLDDVTTRNVMIRDGRLSGIVDLDWVAFGDPLFHLGLTAAAVTVVAPPTGRHYVEELIRFTDVGGEQRRLVDLYEAVFLVNFLGAEWPHRPGPWRAITATAARQRLASLPE